MIGLGPDNKYFREEWFKWHVTTASSASIWHLQKHESVCCSCLRWFLDNPIRLGAGGQSVVCQLESRDAGLPTATQGATGISQFFNAALLRWRSRLPTAFQVPTSPNWPTRGDSITLPQRSSVDFQAPGQQWMSQVASLAFTCQCISFPAMRIISFYCQKVKRPFINGGNQFLLDSSLILSSASNDSRWELWTVYMIWSQLRSCKKMEWAAAELPHHIRALNFEAFAHGSNNYQLIWKSSQVFPPNPAAEHNHKELPFSPLFPVKPFSWWPQVLNLKVLSWTEPVTFYGMNFLKFNHGQTSGWSNSVLLRGLGAYIFLASVQIIWNCEAFPKK